MLEFMRLCTFSYHLIAADEFGVVAMATYSGNSITVVYNVTDVATCTCQLDLGTPVPCKPYCTYNNDILFDHRYVSGNPRHMFTNVPQGEHSVTVTCTSIDDPNLTDMATVTGLEFLDVVLALESAGTTITVLLDNSIAASHRCKLNNGHFVDCKP